MNRTVTQVRKHVEALVNIVTLSGFGTALYLVWVFFTTTPKIQITTQGLWIQGIPFSWIFLSIVLMSLRSTVSALKGLKQWLKD